MRSSPPPFWLTLLGVLASASARAQYLETVLPTVVPGFEQSMGLTVLTRPRPLYQELGVQLGAFTVRGGLNENFGYDSNIVGTPRGISSPFFETNPSVSAESNWSRNRLGASVSMDRFDYLSAPRQSHTDFTVALGGGWTILRDTLDLGYAHVRAHEFGINAGAVAFDAPVTVDIDTVRSAYTLDLGRLRVTPNFQYDSFQFGDALIGGVSVSQRYRDRDVFTGGVTTRWLLSDARALVFVLQGIGSDYRNHLPGVPAPNSASALAMVGIDYQATGPWRYRLLVGGEVRSYEAAQYATRVSPIFEGSLIYMPTELTTVTVALQREIQDPDATGTSGFTLTGVGATIDHELRRDVLLQATGGFRSVDYFNGAGSTKAYSAGFSATWLLSPHFSAQASYRFTRQDADNVRPIVAGAGVTSFLPSFTQHLALVGLKWRL